MRTRLGLVLAVFALVVAACGDDGAGTTTATGATTTDAVVTTTVASSTTGGGGEATEIEVASFTFNPGELTVAAGTTVRWVNQDGVTHTDGVWNGSLSSGGTFEFTFDTPGTYGYICNIHSTMQGTVIVTG